MYYHIYKCVPKLKELHYFLKKVFIVSIIFQGFSHTLLHNIIHTTQKKTKMCSSHIFFTERKKTLRVLMTC